MLSTPQRLRDPVGVLLAGGRGKRIGGAKACVPLAGRPLLAWPLAALTGALERVAVVAKAESDLPNLPRGVVRWDEPALPRHPLTGIIEALRRADGAPVVVCAVDLPLVDSALVARLASLDAGDAPAVIAAARGGSGVDPRPQPLLGRYEWRALAALCEAPADAPLTATVLGLRPALLEVPATALLNVNDERDLRVAADRLRR